MQTGWMQCSRWKVEVGTLKARPMAASMLVGGYLRRKCAWDKSSLPDINKFYVTSHILILANIILKPYCRYSKIYYQNTVVNITIQYLMYWSSMNTIYLLYINLLILNNNFTLIPGWLQTVSFFFLLWTHNLKPDPLKL